MESHLTGSASAAAAVKAAFERHRQVPGASFDSERFLAFLLDPPAAEGSAPPDTFAGRRRFVNFMHDVQLELGMCFSNNEWERHLALDDFIDLVARKAANLSASRALARKRLEYANRNWYRASAIASVFLSPTIFLAIGATNRWLPWVVSAAYAFVVGALAWFGWQDRSYYKDLVTTIERAAS